MKRILIQKLSHVPGGLPPILKESHIAGTIQDSGFSIPIEYSIECFYEDNLQVGKRLILNRYKRNNVFIEGLFITSEVKEINLNSFRTENSKYSYKILED